MTRILLIGHGKMGGALLDGWLKAGLAEQVVVVEPAARSSVTDARVTLVADAADIPPSFRPDALVLAIKPQMMAAVLPAYRENAAGAVVLSIAAGTTLARLGGLLGAGVRLVRAMPNLPASIGQGVTVCCAGPGLDEAGRALATRLLAAVGGVEWLADEALIDAVTAVSGSGPAYLFLLIEALQAAAAEAGLPADLAARLARSTVTGSAALAACDTRPAAELRRDVTSPGGTTEAALRVLMAADGLEALMARAVAAAIARAGELAAP